MSKIKSRIALATKCQKSAAKECRSDKIGGMFFDDGHYYITNGYYAFRTDVAIEGAPTCKGLPFTRLFDDLINSYTETEIVIDLGKVRSVIDEAKKVKKTAVVKLGDDFYVDAKYVLEIAKCFCDKPSCAGVAAYIKGKDNKVLYFSIDGDEAVILPLRMPKKVLDCLLIAPAVA